MNDRPTLHIARRARDAVASARITVASMNRRLNPNIGRRDLLRILAVGAGAAAATAAPIAPAAARSPDADKKQRARYRPNSPDVQSFYRVNRYPPQR
jgi:hypothetical protein